MRRTLAVLGIIAATAAMSAASASGSASVNIIYGTDRNDRIVATPAADVIYAKSGNDTITEVGSGDVVWASSGNDTIRFTASPVAGAAVYGNVGHDKIEGTGLVLDTFVNSGSGNDSIKVNGCVDVQGESGNDTYENRAPCLLGTDTNLGNGHDKFWIYDATSLLLGNGNDQGHVERLGRLHASSGNDKVDVKLAEGSIMELGTGHDELTVERALGTSVFASDGNDKVTFGQAGGNVVRGQSGNDTFAITTSIGANALYGDQNRDKARLGATAGTSCHLIETIVDLAGARRSCA